jgi:hypothetical protein
LHRIGANSPARLAPRCGAPSNGLSFIIIISANYRSTIPTRFHPVVGVKNFGEDVQGSGIAPRKNLAAKSAGACDTAGAVERRKRKMAKSRLTNAAKKIGAAMGRADRTAHKVAKAGVLAKSELKDISKQVEALKKQLMKTTKKLQKALS